MGEKQINQHLLSVLKYVVGPTTAEFWLNVLVKSRVNSLHGC